MEALGVRNGQLGRDGRYFPPPSQNPMARDRSAGVRAEGSRPVRVGLLSGWGVSNVYQPLRKSISAFLGPPPELLLEDPVAGGPRSPGCHGGGRGILISGLG